MSNANPAHQALMNYYNDLKNERSQWESLWQSITKYTLPTSQFSGGKPGSSLTQQIYDGTSISAANMASSELLGMTFNPNSRNFEFEPFDMRKKHDKVHQKFNQYVAGCIQHLLHAPEYGFYTSAHEILVDYVRYGQGHLLIERIGDRPRYLACPMSQCYTELSDDRKVDSIIRTWKWTLRQLRSKYSPEKYPWPGTYLQQMNDPRTMNNKVCVGHAVLKSEDHPEVARLTVFPGKYTHIIFLPEAGGHVLEAKSLDVFPFAAPRYMMMSDENYGRGPGSFADPSTKMVNTMEKTGLRAVQKMADPPLMLPKRGFIRPIDSSPSALNYYDALDGIEIKSFGVDGNPQFNDAAADRHRQMIREFYHVDSMMGPNKKAEMKEVEVLDDQEQRMRAQAPQLARLYTELVHPITSLLLYYFGDEIIAGYDDELPDDIQNTGRLDLRLRYMSPLQRAQSMLDASNVKRVLDGFWLPIAQLDPSLNARFDGEGYTDWLQEAFNLPTQFIRDKDEAQQVLQQQQQQADQATQMTTALDASSALKNVAQAQAAVRPDQSTSEGIF